MQNKSVNYIKMRVILLCLVAVSLGFSAFTLSILFIKKPEDYIFSLLMIIVLILFTIFQIGLTIYNFKKPMAIEKFAFTSNGAVNPISVMGWGLITFSSLILIILGICFYFLRAEIEIKCNAIVIISLGLYLLVNCIFYLIYILVYRTKRK